MSGKRKPEKKELTAAEIVARAQANANMTEKEAMELAVKETRAVRAERVERAKRPTRR